MMFALLMIAAAPAAGGEDRPLRLETRVLAEARSPAADGTTRITLVAPARVVPGDRMVVRIEYRNAGARPLGGLTIADPVPRGLVYRAPAAGSATPELSVDGVHYGALADLRVALPTGGTRAARADDIGHVRWRLAAPLAAGAGGTFAFQAVVK